jgi:hypothetical protein
MTVCACGVRAYLVGLVREEEEQEGREAVAIGLAIRVRAVRAPRLEPSRQSFRHSFATTSAGVAWAKLRSDQLSSCGPSAGTAAVAPGSRPHSRPSAPHRTPSSPRCSAERARAGSSSSGSRLSGHALAGVKCARATRPSATAAPTSRHTPAHLVRDPN